MHPTPVGTSYTLLPYTHAPQSTLPASSHVSTIHACVSSHTHPHFSHTPLSAPPRTHPCPYSHTSRSHLQNPSHLSQPPRAQVLQLSHTHKSRPLRRAHTSLIPCSHSLTPNRVLNVHPALGPPFGLRPGQSGAATSQGVSHGLQGAGWGAGLVNRCWASRIVRSPHGASLGTPDSCRLPCSAGPPWWRRRDSGRTVLHPLLSRPLPQQPAQAATPRRRGRPAEPVRSAEVGG